MNEINTKVEACPVPVAGIAPIKSLMADAAELANTAYARVARVNLEVLGTETVDPPEPMACSLQEALETHRAVLAALCNGLDFLIQGLGV